MVGRQRLIMARFPPHEARCQCRQPRTFGINLAPAGGNSLEAHHDRDLYAPVPPASHVAGEDWAVGCGKSKRRSAASP